MKIYSNVFDLAFPSPNRFWVAPNSDFKIGIKIENKGQSYAGAFALKVNGETLSPDETTTAGFKTYTLKSAGTGSVIYSIEVPDALQKFTLVQIVTDSTVFDVGTSGGGDVPADVATKSWVESQISDFVDEDALTAYATKDELTGYVENGDLTAYYTKTETSSAAELSGEFTAVSARADEAYSLADGAYLTLGLKVDHVPGGTAPEVMNILTYYESEYAQLSVDDPAWEPDPSTMYVILPDQA